MKIQIKNYGFGLNFPQIETFSDLKEGLRNLYSCPQYYRLYVIRGAYGHNFYFSDSSETIEDIIGGLESEFMDRYFEASKEEERTEELENELRDQFYSYDVVTCEQVKNLRTAFN